MIIIGTGSKRLKWLCNQRNSLAMRDAIRSMFPSCWDLTFVVFSTPFNSCGSILFPQHNFRLSSQSHDPRLCLVLQYLAVWGFLSLTHGMACLLVSSYIMVCACLTHFSRTVLPLTLELWLCYILNFLRNRLNSTLKSRDAWKQHEFH